MTRFSIFLFSVILLGTISANAYGHVITDKKYGLSFTKPANFKICSFMDGRRDHDGGYWMDVKGMDVCKPDIMRRSINVQAQYNMASAGLEEYRDSGCRSLITFKNETTPQCTNAPEGLTIPDVQTLSARIDHANGVIMIHVYAQGGKVLPPTDPQVRFMNYFIELRTNAIYFDQDLRTLRDLLNSFKLASPGN